MEDRLVELKEIQRDPDLDELPVVRAGDGIRRGGRVGRRGRRVRWMESRCRGTPLHVPWIERWHLVGGPQDETARRGAAPFRDRGPESGDGKLGDCGE
ncbi:MAG: hypothetical protein OXI80_02215 [Caldilineaceae bacterium]|nr:hypothetical protein [Caldilineaceae bacterium]